jgi:hypothetical protein
VTLIGAIAAGATVALLVVATDPQSTIERRLRAFGAAARPPRSGSFATGPTW